MAMVGGREVVHDHMKDAFDDMMYYYEGEGHSFNATFYHELVECLHKFNDSTLYLSQIAAWKGIADYWLSNATNKDYMGRPDPWGQSSPALEGDLPPFEEFYNRPNVTIGRYNILTYEPCNYPSNIAYYHSVTKICKYDWSISPEMQHNLIKAMATHAVGSAFMHQSYTYVGSRFDNLMISIISYLGHQIMVENIPNKSPILVGLQRQKRSMNSSEVITNITETIRTEPAPIWAKVMDHGDYPHEYFTTFGAMVCNLYSFLLPGFLANGLVSMFARLLLPPEMKEWVADEYLPEIIRASRRVRIPILKKQAIFIKFMGIFAKLLPALAFQEQFLPIPGFKTHPILKVGGFLIPYVNGIADHITGFRQTDENVNKSHDLYPGHKFCKYDQGHSIWHELSANFLLDLMFFCDYLNQLVLEHAQ